MGKGSSKGVVKSRYSGARIGRSWNKSEISVRISEYSVELVEYGPSIIANENLAVQYIIEKDPVDF